MGHLARLTSRGSGVGYLRRFGNRENLGSHHRNGGQPAKGTTPMNNMNNTNTRTINAVASLPSRSAQPTMAEMQAQLAKLQAENQALKAKKEQRLALKVSAKGALSLYGIGRWPVTLYKEQWIRVLDIAEDIRTFIADNDGSLKAKGDDAPAEEAAA